VHQWCLKAETSGDNAAEEWSTLVNWEEDHAIKAKQRSSKHVAVNSL